MIQASKIQAAKGPQCLPCVLQKGWDHRTSHRRAGSKWLMHLSKGLWEDCSGTQQMEQLTKKHRNMTKFHFVMGKPSSYKSVSFHCQLWFMHKGNLQDLSPETPPYFARSANRTASACQGTYICGHSLGKSEGDKYSKTLRWSKMAILSHPSLQVETLVGVKRTGTLKSSIYCAYGIIRHSNLLHILFIDLYGKNLAATRSNFSFGSPQASICKYMQVGPGFPSSWIFKIPSMYL